VNGSIFIEEAGENTMNYQELPTDKDSILAFTWNDLEPYYRELESRPLTAGNIQGWLKDWSRLAETADEQYWRLNIETTVNTADDGIEEQYIKYVDEMQPLVKTAEQKLKDKLLASGLSPAGFETALRVMQAEAEIFREENLPLLAEEQKLVTEYNQIRGSLTVMWEGQERTFYEMFALRYETDRSIRQRAWEALQARLLEARPSFNDLWEKFMPLRLQIAENAGMPDFRAYMWKQRFRFDYSPEDCKSFHAAIEQVVVPAAERVYERRRQRLAIDSARPWDKDVDPHADTPIKPSQSNEDFLAKTLSIFQYVDPAFGGYFQTMIDEGLLDIENRKNKASGAYSLGLHAIHRPFIFMSNTNTPEDVQTILH
jgi:oligoendopeptidase F